MSTDVLVVEDDDAVRSSFVKVLEHAGFRVTSAENGQAALDALADLDHSCRAIVCDLHMPVLTGMGFMRKLRTEFPHLIDRVLFVTAYDRDSDLRRFLTTTGLPYLSKPVDIALLVETVRMVVDAAEDAAPR